LYDLIKDPNEEKNSAERYRDVCKNLKKQLLSELGDFNLNEGEMFLDAGVKERLEALGYLT
jgi:hypothetical protein